MLGEKIKEKKGKHRNPGWSTPLTSLYLSPTELNKFVASQQHKSVTIKPKFAVIKI